METQNEKISLLLDDELGAADAKRLLGHMREDHDLQAAWRRYHLMRQGLRGETPVLANGDFAARLAQRMAAEPVFLRPKRQRREWLQPAGGLALAAAISALAVLGMREYGVGHMPDTADGWITASSGESEVRGVQQAGYGLLSPEKLSEYLAMHSDGVYSAGAGDLLPQARVVSIANP